MRNGGKRRARPHSRRASDLCALAVEKLVDVGDHGRDFADDENVRAEVENFLRHVAIDAVDESDYGNNRSHADHDAQQRQRGAQLVRPQRLQRDADGFERWS